ncbi:MAG: hypothetical protein EAZ86_25095 [Oscillatoriales cyanobacterium]|nr:MAG: hypothetical protein EAZ86_25095 [Oscillatoriales cyanobacterium]
MDSTPKLASYQICFSLNRQDACSTKSEFFCGTGILPVAKRLIKNDTTSYILFYNFNYCGMGVPPVQKRRAGRPSHKYV